MEQTPAMSAHRSVCDDAGTERRSSRRSALPAANVLILAAIGVLALAPSASGIKCYTNNKNDVTILPTNSSTEVTCKEKQLCGAVKILNPPSYFAQNCGPNFDQPCSCMLACVPMWVTDGEGAWVDPVNKDAKGKARTQVCTSDLCNVACSAASSVRRSGLLLAVAAMTASLLATASS